MVVWHKSSWSAYNGNCVEVAEVGDLILIRDTKDNGAGPILCFTRTAWREFVGGLKRGDVAKRCGIRRGDWDLAS